jgi:hypothetical protein
MSVYLLYYLVGFVVRPWELYCVGTSALWDYMGFSASSADVLWTMIVVLVAHASVMAGFVFSNTGRTQVPIMGPFSFVPRRPVTFFVIVSLFMVLGAYASLKSIGTATSTDVEELIAEHVSTDDAGGQRLVDVSGYQTVFVAFIPVTIIVLFATRRLRVAGTSILILFVVYRMFGGSGRSEFVLLLLAVGCILLIDARRHYPPVTLVVAGIVLLALFNLIGSDRMAFRKIAAGQISFTELWDSYSQSRRDAPVTGDMQEFDVLSAVLTIIPERSGYTYGTQYLRLLIWPIPRQLWSDKPVLTSIVNMAEFGHFEYLTLTLYAESYMSIGIAGMIAVLFIISIALNRLYNNMVNLANPTSIVIYFMALMNSPILFRDGAVSFGYQIIVTGIGSFILCRGGGLRTVWIPAKSESRGMGFLIGKRLYT